MALIMFYGSVLPVATGLTRTFPRVDWKDKELGLELHIDISIVNSGLTIACESNRYSTHQDMSEIYKRVFDTARAAVDCLAYIKGLGLGLILERVTPPNGIQQDQDIIVERPELAKLVTSFRAEQ